MQVDQIIDRALARFIGTKHERDIKKIQPLVVEISALEPEIQALSDEQMKERMDELRRQVQEQLKEADPAASDYRQKLDEALGEVLVPTFALVRESGRRNLGLRHFDVQLIGGIVLHQGKIAEMKTGEGKTLVATLPAVLNSLAGRGVHIITVNDYLARRDAEWMGPLYTALGLKVGVIVNDLADGDREVSYGADVTYGTNNEYGFDYLRDNMKYDIQDCVQRGGHQFAIVDEVDSILIDEARTPLIISGPAEESTDKYYRIDKLIPKLIKDIDFTVDEKHHAVTLTEEGVSKCERLLSIHNLFDLAHIDTLHAVEQGLRAHHLYHRDVEYVVKDGEVIIVDEFTGRQMPGRRWSDGLHQAVEAKEGVKIERENQTLATVTFQNYFRMYKKLAGMTGTAETEAAEFQKIYNLDVVVVPTNKTLLRLEHPDVVYRTDREKFEAVANGILQEDNSLDFGIKQLHAKGQPILVGTVSIEKSEMLSEMLKRSGIRHEVLNAKQHEREAQVIAQAGRKGAVTVSTNMAGRGTDILLGGNPEALTREFCLKERLAIPYAPAAPLVSGEPQTGSAMVLFQYEGRIYQVPGETWKPILDRFAKECQKEHAEVVALGGLHVLGTERHEARRIDNQLRGRAGRQGDPGSSRFFLSLEDELLRLFGGERLQGLMYRLGMTEGVPIESKMISNRIEHAQQAREAQFFDMRKHLLEYDDVMNKQRETIYSIRRAILEGKEQRDYVLEIADDIALQLLDTYCPRDQHPQMWNTTQFAGEVLNQFGIDVKTAGLDTQKMSHDDICAALVERVKTRYEEKEKVFGAEAIRFLERRIILDIVDGQWKDHLLSLDHLKEGIGLRGYGQKDPLVEFKKEAFTLFEDMMERIDTESVRFLFLMQPAKPAEQEVREIEERHRRQQAQIKFSAGPAQAEPPKPVRAGAKVGRNDPCPCGSGKKYKKCHGTTNA